jgi:PAS domain S-box-containing protein
LNSEKSEAKDAQSAPSTPKKDQDVVMGYDIFLTLIEQAAYPVMIIQDSKIVFINKSGWHKFGYSKEKTIGVRVENLIRNRVLTQSTETVIKGYSQVMCGEEPEISSFPIIAENGEFIPIEPIVAKISYNGREAIIIIIRDIRDKPNIELPFEKGDPLVLISVSSKIAGNLRNPLQSLKTAFHYVKGELQANSSYLRNFRKIEAMLDATDLSIHRASQLLRELSDYSELNPPMLELLDLNALVEEAITRSEVPKNIILETALGQISSVGADRQQMSRVFSNMITNAVEAMPAGGILRITSALKDGFVEVSFTDNGVGIPKNRLETLFEPFFTTKQKHLGLGLTVSKRFAEANQGQIEVTCAPKATTFIVRLPLVDSY